MKIGPDLPQARWQRAAVALGHQVPYLDNARNVRPATLAEMEEFCFGPLRKITLDYEERIARAANPVSVTAFDATEVT